MDLNLGAPFGFSLGSLFKFLNLRRSNNRLVDSLKVEKFALKSVLTESALLSAAELIKTVTILAG